jgi:hypothetical protein
LLHAISEQEEGEQLEQREAQLQEGLEALVAKIEGVSRERTDYIQVTGGERLAEDREFVMQSIIAGGTWMQKSDQRYWLYAWTDVGLKMISEFHQIQQVDEIERQLGELMEEEAYQIKADVDDPLNSQLYKVQALYKAMNTWLRDRSSAL